LTSFGLDLTQAMNSCADFAGTDGCTASAITPIAHSMTGTKLVTGS
jgi:hypothetical protein